MSMRAFCRPGEGNTVKRKGGCGWKLVPVAWTVERGGADRRNRPTKRVAQPFDDRREEQ